MKRTTFSVMLVLLFLAGLVVTTGAAGDEPVEVVIPVWKHLEEYEIHPGEVAVIRYGWAACSPGLVSVFIGASNWEVTLVDSANSAEVLHLTPADFDDLWGAIHIYETPPDFAEDCVGKGKPAWAEWRYVLPDQEVARYELRTWWWLDHNLIDGGDYDEDGKPDVFTPDIVNDTLNIITYYDE